MSAHIVSIIRTLYAAGMAGLALYGAHNLIMVILFLRERFTREKKNPRLTFPCQKPGRA